MKKFNLLIIFVLCLNLLFAQNPMVKQWDYRFGGINEEDITCMQPTLDGGYILGGCSASGIGGDKTQNTWGQEDYWIVKTDSLGIKQWDKNFGGNGHDILRSIQQTADGGYILGGGSNSGISGDKTQPVWDTCLICVKGDFWIVKTDALGNKQWDKNFGGKGAEALSALQQTADGGYILGGWSTSGISGDKTEASRDTVTVGSSVGDYWMVKIDSSGNMQWDKRFGGANGEVLSSLQQTADGGYILGGYSNSGVSGDKTQITKGNEDYWIVKTDALGNMQWDKDLGGYGQDYLEYLQQTADGGFILGGLSGSGISGDKSQPTRDTCSNCLKKDFWIVKTDTLGIKQWDRDFGGELIEDEFGNISETNDGGYLIAGVSYSNAGGDKSEDNLGAEQTWIIKTNALGVKQWDKTIFTNGHDEQGFAFQTTDGCYTITNYTDAGAGGYKTQPAWGSYDYWMVKFCDSTLSAGIYPGLANNARIVIHPNPFTSAISIATQKENVKQVTVVIKNLLGQTVFSSTENNTSGAYHKTANLTFLSNGIYLLEVNVDGEMTVKKIMKE